MICVSIGRGRHRHMIAEYKHLAEEGAQLVELRLDYIAGEVNLRRLLAERHCPVVIACRRRQDGGRWTKPEAQRMMLLRQAIADGVDYIDLEDDVAGQVPRFGKTKRIVSLHDFQKTPDDLEAIWNRLAKLDPDIIKIAALANHPHDNVRMLRLVGAAKIPTIGICMGEMGIPTRILCGKFGSPFTYATFSAERALAPGQLDFQQMRTLYNYDAIRASTDVFGVIADPVGHSLSPLIHNAAYRAAGLDKVYLPFRVPKEDLRQFIADAAELGILGLSVTIPHKEAVLEFLTQSEAAVQGIGASNTVVFDGPKRIGYNTDYRAAMESLEEAIAGQGNSQGGQGGQGSQGSQGSQGQPDAANGTLKGKSVLVLGAGGVGKAIAFGLLRRGASVTVSDGDTAKATALAEALRCRWIDWTLRHNCAADVLVNGTPIGMHPNVNDTPYKAASFKPSMVVFDAVYNPENTLLIKEARARGCKVVTGVDMFVRQACLQFKLFTGTDGPADMMRETIKRATSAAKV